MTVNWNGDWKTGSSSWLAEKNEYRSIKSKYKRELQNKGEA
jgi:hypothetical protein